MLMECLVYISLVFVVLAAGYAALYHCIDNALVLRRNADDIAAALQAGERWRADFRQATGPSRHEASSEGETLFLQGQRGEIAYRFSGHVLLRRVGDGVWTTLLERVKSSTMTREERPNVTAWRWELELEPRTKGSIKASRVRPLFSFLAVPASGSAQ
jgi:hypothetical protein